MSKTQTKPPKKPATKVEKAIYIILLILGSLACPPIGIFWVLMREANKEEDNGNIKFEDVDETSNPLIDADHRCFSTNLLNDSRYSSHDD